MVFNKVFCIGMSKTGTKSLSTALNIIGIQTLHWLPESEVIEQLEAGDLRLKVLEDKDGLTDVIGIRWFKELDRQYAGSKFLLTVREKEDWLASIANFWPYDDPYKREHAHYYYRISVFGCLDYHRDHFWDVYLEHVRNVREYFADRPDQLLEIDVCGGEGWEKLCPFLNVKVPGAPFPHLHQRRSKVTTPTELKENNS
ncbi:sulfotransferase family protein [bacterium]|nr:sulfotransferase family protein [bacterium]